MNRRSHTAASAYGSTSTSPSLAATTAFDDQDNFLLSALIALHEDILGNTAASGPSMEIKNRVWGLIKSRICGREGAVERTEDQVRSRWRTIRSTHSFKTDKARNICESYYKKIAGTPHKIRLSDITVPGIKFPTWMTAMIKNDGAFKAKSTEAEPPQKMKRSNRGMAEDAPPPKRKSTRKSESTVPTLVPQYPPSELSDVRYSYRRNVKHEDTETPVSNTTSPNSNTPEELNSVTESGNNTRPPSVTVFWEESEYEARRRREEEIHQAQLALLRSQKQQSDAKTRLTNLQIKAYLTKTGGSDEDLGAVNADIQESEALNTTLPNETLAAAIEKAIVNTPPSSEVE